MTKGVKLNNASNFPNKSPAKKNYHLYQHRKSTINQQFVHTINIYIKCTLYKFK